MEVFLPKLLSYRLVRGGVRILQILTASEIKC